MLRHYRADLNGLIEAREKALELLGNNQGTEGTIEEIKAPSQIIEQRKKEIANMKPPSLYGFLYLITGETCLELSLSDCTWKGNIKWESQHNDICHAVENKQYVTHNNITVKAFPDEYVASENVWGFVCSFIWGNNIYVALDIARGGSPYCVGVNKRISDHEYEPFAIFPQYHFAVHSSVCIGDTVYFGTNTPPFHSNSGDCDCYSKHCGIIITLNMITREWGTIFSPSSYTRITDICGYGLAVFDQFRVDNKWYSDVSLYNTETSKWDYDAVNDENDWIEGATGRLRLRVTHIRWFDRRLQNLISAQDIDSDEHKMAAAKFEPAAVSVDTERIIAKYKKRVDRERAELVLVGEQKDNQKRVFKMPNDQYWYVQFEVAAGPYAGQKHIVEIKLLYGAPPDIYVYPASPPKCTFMTRIWHPNISERGIVCLDVLKDNWSPMMRIDAALNAIELMLAEPNTASPQNKAAALMLENDAPAFAEKIKTFYDGGAGTPADVAALFA